MELFKILWDQIILCKHKKEIKKILSSACRKQAFTFVNF